MDDRALALVTDAGKTLLENGSEVFRAQQTMEIMAKSLGIQDFNVYVLTNGIFASAQDGAKHAVRHIPAVSIHLGRVEAVNALSRRLAAGQLDLDSAERALAEARAMPAGRPQMDVLAGALGSGCFAYLFGGGLPEVLVAALAGTAEMLLQQWAGPRRINRIFTDILAAGACTILAILSHRLLPGLINADNAIIGALMVLTPGVALTMGIRDFINADYLSGTIRLFDALLVAGSLACGVALGYMLTDVLWGVLP